MFRPRFCNKIRVQQSSVSKYEMADVLAKSSASQPQPIALVTLNLASPETQLWRDTSKKEI